MAGEVHVDVDDRVATLTIDNTEKRNALGPPLLAKITDAVRELEERDDVRCLVITGAGEKAFSSGFDISYHQRNYEGGVEGPDVEGEEVGFDEMVDRVKHFDYPVIARINGGTFGGSMHLIAACDFRIAVEDAQFGITPAKLGMIYGGEAIGEIMAHVGPSNVKELLFTAEFIDADRAYDMGLLNDVVPREELDSRTYGMAETIASNAPLSLTGMKEIIRALMDKDSLTDAEKVWAETLEQEAEDSRDHQEGVEAFMEGREPEFEGY
ncbi:enoyl-CoA hydratase/isomerase family protein [Natronomonas sp. F2-12]|uniref:Enoyl-CoA hydratase/isomerase family protein n=1 Tax=Natronomonas aquatica TaxID=2841590 RepID=A0A9R1D4H0_9EURY|nr:enoyl-CoA hydratase-related protein [Natronomonas aquatica]MCQ4333359.1 enoyl-CoA hydratase/isomerase family protein [Natronomonas aquatica]